MYHERVCVIVCISMPMCQVYQGDACALHREDASQVHTLHVDVQRSHLVDHNGATRSLVLSPFFLLRFAASCVGGDC